MNKKVIAVLILTVLALAVLTLVTYGPLSGIGKLGMRNPSSLQPQGSQPVPVNNQQLSFSSYSNKDVAENYYTVQVPQDWKVGAGQTPGSYEISFPQGTGTISLMDVPDNSTLELLVLSQEEPRLKETVSGYQRIDYRKLTIQGSEAYQLIYQSASSSGVQGTVTTYIAGPDHSAVVSFTAPQAALTQFLPIIATVTGSLQWGAK